MSAWRISLQSLYAKGPGQHTAASFDRCDCPLAVTQRGLYQCTGLGYIASHPGRNGSRNEYRYSITPLGLDLIEGRAARIPGGPKNGERGKYKTARNWLASLPAPNSIRVAPDQSALTMGQRMARGDTAVQLAPPAPPCFGTRLQWTEYVRSCAIAHRGDHLPGPLVLEAGAPVRFNPNMAFCSDCNDSHAYVMRSEGRCKPRHLIEVFAVEAAKGHA